MTTFGWTCDFIVDADYSTWMLADIAQEPIIGFVGFTLYAAGSPGSWREGSVFTLDGDDIVANNAETIT